MTDPALLHVTLLFSAWSLVTLQGRAPTPVVMFHKAESIRQLNKSLLIPNRAPSDSTIAVVACLTKFEVFAPRSFLCFCKANMWSEPIGKWTWR
jgi:hypothetical protein